MLKVKTIKGQTIYINPEHIISIRDERSSFHVSIIDFGFDISYQEFMKIREQLNIKED